MIDEIVVSGAAKHDVPALRHGVGRWHLAPGVTAASDPVPLPVDAGEELSISCFVAGTTEPATYLHSAQRTSEIAAGNQTSDRHLRSAQSSPSLYWIARVLVDAPAQGPVIVAIGDSITRGDFTTLDADQRYPDHLQRLLPAGAVVLNAGLGANRILRSGLGPPMAERFERDVLSVTETTHVIVMGGINDIALPKLLGESQPTAAVIVDGLNTLARRARERGISPLLGTITPVGESRIGDFVGSGNEDIRLAVNQAIRAQAEWPVVDFAAAVAEAGDADRLARSYDSGDGLHPNDAGARALAGEVDLNLLTGSASG
ncbi:GDSL-type esterase/lipase family protein [Fodinicola feengrottensis]|uniref:GDSL-type esterase/lipase family protein n=1 Tax=Fodinicola feengrottensis TaxID=435914 RepID=UPI0013D49A6B|nr:GDSL-type esterase/lipase family protein [Fodinicola feengrottensis]